MAFDAKKIFPIDKKPSVAVGVGIPFAAPAVFTSTYTTQQAIKNNLINFFLTGTGLVKGRVIELTVAEIACLLFFKR